MKNFDWNITQLSASHLEIDFTFEHPKYISSDESRLDVALVTYMDAELLFQPLEENLSAIESGYTVSINLPP